MCVCVFQSKTIRQRQSRKHLQCGRSAVLRRLRDDLQLLHTLGVVNDPVDDCRTGGDGVALPHLRNYACKPTGNSQTANQTADDQ